MGNLFFPFTMPFDSNICCSKRFHILFKSDTLCTVCVIEYVVQCECLFVHNTYWMHHAHDTAQLSYEWDMYQHAWVLQLQLSSNKITKITIFFVYFPLQQFTQPAVIEQMAYVLIGCGALMFFLSFLGYCGAIRESQCMLTTVSYGIVCLIIGFFFFFSSYHILLVFYNLNIHAWNRAYLFRSYRFMGCGWRAFLSKYYV